MLASRPWLWPKLRQAFMSLVKEMKLVITWDCALNSMEKGEKFLAIQERDPNLGNFRLKR